MPKDRSWVLLDDHRLDAFQKGCVEFLDFAFEKAAIDDKIRCPCRDCKCRKFGDREFVHKHLLWRGSDKSYGTRQWTMHLEFTEDYNSCDPICETNENKTNDGGTTTKKQMGVENQKPCRISDRRSVYDIYLLDGGSESTINSIVCHKVLGTSKKCRFKRSNTKMKCNLSENN